MKQENASSIQAQALAKDSVQASLEMAPRVLGGKGESGEEPKRRERAGEKRRVKQRTKQTRQVNSASAVEPSIVKASPLQTAKETQLALPRTWRLWVLVVGTKLWLCPVSS